MSLDDRAFEQLIALVGKYYPDWSSFSDPRFQKDEIDYKRATVAKAEQLLSEAELRKLIADQECEEFRVRLHTIGHDNDLLWKAVPMQGDLNVLYQETLDKPSFCAAVLDLLYGPGPSYERLERYAGYVTERDLPNKWTFPTYLLFVCHPDSEMFVTPSRFRWLLQFLSMGDAWTIHPSASTYQTIIELCEKLGIMLADFGANDMVDVQSFIFVAHHAATSMTVSPERREEFGSLFAEFLVSYPPTPDGQRHMVVYREGREQARKNFDSILAAVERGEDVTDAVLLRLLPHADTTANRDRGAWVHVAPAITGDLKGWFEAKGWTKPRDWPAVAEAILAFVRHCVEDPAQLPEACAEFSDRPYSKGFQTGMLTPILNALRPDEFLLVNNKSRRVINHFASTSYSQNLMDYPATNATGHRVIEELGDMMDQSVLPEMRDDDLFDTFCHWLVAVNKYDFAGTRYWKIAPGERAWNWEACRDGGFIAMGWDELGDISELSRTEFDARRDALVAEHDDWTKVGPNQVWRFAHHISEGDLVVANDGTTKVLGIGTVTGPYYFVEGVRHGHRMPVDWDDVNMRRVDEGGWRRTLVPLDRTKFQEILRAAPLGAAVHPDSPFSESTFEMLAKLHEEPTYEFYTAHKDALRQHVMEPFKRLMMGVRGHLPLAILANMETEKRVFANILKQFAKQGCWDFYWGAFYPKGGKRIEDAQLFMWINRDSLDFGFYIGEYGRHQRSRFVRNCTENYPALVRVLRDSFVDTAILFGEYGDYEGGSDAFEPDKLGPSFEDWLRDPSEAGIHAAAFLRKEQVLQCSMGQLGEEIADVFEKLFPLVILAVQDDPMPLIGEYIEGIEPPEIEPEYPLAECARETHFDEEMLERWVRAIERKKQAIVYGPPGTGKTFLAERLARHLVGGGDGFFDIVQFHPAYAYEDFVQGIRPQARADGGLSYPLLPGRFLEFCGKAQTRRGRCVLIIDEINRANLARVLGELMYLLEYRDQEVPLAAGRRFSIPANVRIIGTMNTADRSIALVDHALRRRFAFLALHPEYQVLRRYHSETNFPVEGLIRTLQRLNGEIGDRHYEVGITFFLTRDLRNQIEDIWRMEIEPYLEEYFFDQQDKVDRFRWDAIGRDVL